MPFLLIKIFGLAGSEDVILPVELPHAVVGEDETVADAGELASGRSRIEADGGGGRIGVEDSDEGEEEDNRKLHGLFASLSAPP